MSWKSFACVAALSALITSPALAVGTISVDLVRDGSGIAQLDANGDWQWELVVTTDADGSTASELEAFITDSDLVSAALASPAVFDTDNPSPSTLAWISEDGSGILTGGLQSNLATSEAVIAVGGDDVVAGSYTLATFVTDGPSTSGSLSSTLSVSGNVAHLGLNNLGQAVSYTATAIAGDTDLDGDVDPTDLNNLLFSFGGAATWSGGELDGIGTVDPTDLNALLFNFGSTGSAPATATAVPEPVAATTAAIALLGLLGFRGRKS